MTRLGTIGELRILSVHAPDRTFVSLAGALDIATREHLVDSLRASLARIPAGGAFEIDLAEVEFGDSTGVRSLLDIREEAAGSGVDVSFTNPGRQLRFVIDLLERPSRQDVAYPDATRSRPGPPPGGPDHPEVHLGF